MRAHTQPKLNHMQGFDGGTVAAGTKTAAEILADTELLAALDQFDAQWPLISAARVRSVLQANGFVVSEKRAKALKAQRVVQAGATTSRPAPTMTEEALVQKSVADKAEKTLAENAAAEKAEKVHKRDTKNERIAFFLCLVCALHVSGSVDFGFSLSWLL